MAGSDRTWPFLALPTSNSTLDSRGAGTKDKPELCSVASARGTRIDPREIDPREIARPEIDRRLPAPIGDRTTGYGLPPARYGLTPLAYTIG